MSWTYDHFGRVTEIDQPGSVAVTYAYDAVGSRTWVDAWCQPHWFALGILETPSVGIRLRQ
jgi:YD repeat-containing protein